MNTYRAILAAADHIERTPTCFRFVDVRIPVRRTSTGCALGWIQHFRGLRGFIALGFIHTWGLGRIGPERFYDRLCQLCRPEGAWHNNPQVLVKGLRLYAQEYHAPRRRDWPLFSGPTQRPKQGQPLRPSLAAFGRDRDLGDGSPSTNRT